MILYEATTRHDRISSDTQVQLYTVTDLVAGKLNGSDLPFRTLAVACPCFDGKKGLVCEHLAAVMNRVIIRTLWKPYVQDLFKTHGSKAVDMGPKDLTVSCIFAALVDSNPFSFLPVYILFGEETIEIKTAIGLNGPMAFGDHIDILHTGSPLSSISVVVIQWLNERIQHGLACHACEKQVGTLEEAVNVLQYKMCVSCLTLISVADLVEPKPFF